MMKAALRSNPTTRVSASSYAATVANSEIKRLVSAIRDRALHVPRFQVPDPPCSSCAGEHPGVSTQHRALDTDDDTDDEPLIEGDDDDAKLRKLAEQVEALAAK
jgi:hypothetical protein